MSRRAPAALAAAVLLVLLGAGRADAQAAPPKPKITIYSADRNGVSGNVTTAGIPAHLTIWLQVSAPGDLPSGCSVPADPKGEDVYANGYEFTFPLTGFNCNGAYTATVTATSYGPVSTSQSTEARVITLADEAPAATGLTATSDGTTVTITWAAPAGTGPDFLGYRLDRLDANKGGKVVSSADAGPEATSATDKPPAGRYTYVLRAKRYGSAATTDVSTKDPVTVTAPAPDASSSSSSSASSDSSSSSGLPITSESSSGVTVIPGAGGITITGTPRRGGGSGGTSAQNPTVEPDEGYSSQLPYEPEPGEIAASRPQIRTQDKKPGAGLAVPFGVASVLGAWAVHVLYLTRQARLVDASLLPLDVEQPL